MKIVSATILALALVGCAAEAGPPGPPGRDGTPGTPGTQGTPGTPGESAPVVAAATVEGAPTVSYAPAVHVDGKTVASATCPVSTPHMLSGGCIASDGASVLQSVPFVFKDSPTYWECIATGVPPQTLTVFLICE